MVTNAQPSEATADEGRREAVPLTVQQIVWLRFKRNKLAIAGGIVLLIMYLAAIFAGFLAPYAVNTTHSKHAGVGPNGMHVFDQDGKFHWPPFVYGYVSSIDPATYRRVAVRTEEMYPVHFLGRGDPYTVLGIISGNRHLFAVEDPAKVFLLGTDTLGRDLFSRILYGAQVSLSVGLIGVFLSLTIGSSVGVVAGLYGGAFDNIAMRIVEVLTSFPQIPLWMALASALPPTLNSLQVYFGITVVLSFLNWGGLARQVRAKVLALRDSDYVTSAKLNNCSTARVVAKHLFPNTISHVLVVATLAIPGMILGETSLSFLGLGIRPPMTSWGLLLSEAQAVRVLLQQPWLLTPIVPVMVTAISFNLLGDGLRDAADPFAD
jgi:peptide/nickel transport system permease protein